MNQSPTAPLRVDYPPVANRDEMPMAKGRNGWVYTIALSMLPIGVREVRSVRLEPFTSRDLIGSCAIDVPFDEQVLRTIGEKFLELAAHAKAQAANSAQQAASAQP